MKNIAELLDTSWNLDYEKIKKLWDSRFQLTCYHDEYGISFRRQKNYKNCWQRIKTIDKDIALKLIEELPLVGIQDSIFRHAKTFVRKEDAEAMLQKLLPKIEKARLEYQHLITMVENLEYAV